MPYVRVVDVIPNSDSAEAYQHSEPSLAVDPFDPTQIIVGAFGFPDLFPNTPYFKSTDGGATWSSYGRLFSQDKSIAWTQDGSTALTATLLSDVIRTRLGTAAASDFGSPINAFDPSHELDQPWIRTGPSGHVYVAYNDLSARPNTASVLVSTNGGSDYTPFTLDRVGGSAPYPFDLDAPSVRLAVNGDTVYGVFVRFNTVVQNDPGDRRAGSQVVVVRSDNGGADGFIALGDGVEVAATIWADTDNVNSPLGLGQERTGSELAIAVDPNNPNRLVVAYSDAPVLGQLQLVVAESIDGGATWTTKFTTSSSTRSAQPALAILESGGVGLLYNNYDPLTDKLSQHLLTTTDDFATTTDITLATESNATPALQSHPYVGDFFDLTSVGDTFFGIFSASNADNGTDAQFPNVSFLRPFTGALGMSSFQLTDAAGNPVAISIDPFFFSYSPLSTPWILLADGDFTGDGIADLMWLDPSTGDTIEWVMSPAGGVGSIPFTSGVQGWNLLADGDFNGDGTTDLMWQHASSGATAEWLMAPTGGVGSMLSTPGAEGWSLIADGDFNGDGTTDLMWQHASSGATAEWLMAPTGGVGVLLSTPLAQGWNLIATGDFNGDGTTDLMWQHASSGATAEWLMAPTGGVGSMLSTPGAEGWSLLATGDFNGDGTTDLMWQHASSGATAEWLMAPTGGVGVLLSTPLAQGWNLLADGDFNGDSIADLMWQYASSGATAEWLMAPTGGVGSMLSTPGAQGWNLLTTGDFNGDDTTDLMWKNASSAATSEWLMAKTGGLATNPATPPVQAWNLVATDDFDGDGITDLMWQNVLSDGTSEWLMSANGGLGGNPATPVAGTPSGGATDFLLA